MRATIDLWFTSWNDCLATLPASCDPAPIEASRSGAAFDAAAMQIEIWINRGVTIAGVDTRRLGAVESVSVEGDAAHAVVCVSDQASVIESDGSVSASGFVSNRHQLELGVVDGAWKVLRSDIVATTEVEGELLCVGS